MKSEFLQLRMRFKTYHRPIKNPANKSIKLKTSLRSKINKDDAPQPYPVMLEFKVIINDCKISIYYINYKNIVKKKSISEHKKHQTTELCSSCQI